MIPRRAQRRAGSSAAPDSSKPLAFQNDPTTLSVTVRPFPVMGISAESRLPGKHPRLVSMSLAVMRDAKDAKGNSVT